VEPEDRLAKSLDQLPGLCRAKGLHVSLLAGRKQSFGRSN
jgi:hypothetical protein